jgi:hypothetical protein
MLHVDSFFTQQMDSSRPQLQEAYFIVTFAIKVGYAADHLRTSRDQLTCPVIPILCPEL